MMEKVSGFIIVWKLRFHTIINAPRGSHCSGMEECRLRDPPQAENPALQDSFYIFIEKTSCVIYWKRKTTVTAGYRNVRRKAV